MLGKPLNQDDMDDAFAVADEDGSGELDFEEFYDWLIQFWLKKKVDDQAMPELPQRKPRKQCEIPCTVS